MDVIDGQHRLMAAKSLGYEIYYITVPGAGLAEVHMLNTAAKRWTYDDFMNGYCDLGLGEYKKYRQYHEDWGLPHAIAIKVLCDPTQVKGAIQDFKEGDFTIVNEGIFLAIAEVVHSFEPYYPKGYLRRSFVFAVVKLATNKRFEHRYLLDVLKDNAVRIVDATTAREYLRQLEEIYRIGGREIRLF